MQKIIKYIENTQKYKKVDQYIKKSNENLYYIHKWSKQEKKYSDYELRLPPKLNVLSQNTYDIDSRTIAFGGTRSPTAEAFMQAHTMAYLLAEAGYLLISGGVVGIDLAMHLGALDSIKTKPSTCAVLANPVECMLAAHGWEEKKISQDIYRHGCFISEYIDYANIGSKEHLERLLQRDRIISGLSDIFIAFECSVDSATVDTAKRAYLQGKRVYVVHPIQKTKRKGTYQLEEETWVKKFDINVFLNSQ